jgi:GH24 family phage-related lysozyme (muramidase)
MAEEEIVDSGTMWTPESARMKRRLAEAMLKAGMSTEPISSHWQGLARIANAMLGGYEMHSLGKEDSARAREEREYSNAPYKPSPSLTADPAGVKSPKPTDVADASQPAPASGTPDFREWVKKKEGWNPNAYGDYKQTSIGYGTRANPGEKTISREEGEKRLDVELGKARMLVQSWGQGQGVKLSPKQEDALTDLTYNAGTTWMNEGLGAAMKSGDLPRAQKQFEGYIHAGGKPLPGLIVRRRELSPWLLDTSSGPTQVAQAQQPGVIPDVPQPIPGVVLDGANAPAAPPVPVQGVPPTEAISAALSDGAPPGPPMASPAAAQPQAAPQGPMTRDAMLAKAYEYLGSRGEIVKRGLDHQNPNIAKAARAEISNALKHVESEHAKRMQKDAPSGHTWLDPADHSKGVKRIPGMEEKIPGEVAGKIAMMNMARDRIKDTRKVFEREWGAGDMAKWAASNVPGVGDLAFLSGDVGIAQRDVQTGIEAALRTMTGAAAPDTEVVRYARMFMPGPQDTIESAKQKLDGLVKFMEDAEKLVMQGRGAVQLNDAMKMLDTAAGGGAKSAAGGAAPGGQKRLKFNPKTGEIE